LSAPRSRSRRNRWRSAAVMARFPIGLLPMKYRDWFVTN
jgi:hypothetical protein